MDFKWIILAISFILSGVVSGAVVTDQYLFFDVVGDNVTKHNSAAIICFYLILSKALIYPVLGA